MRHLTALWDQDLLKLMGKFCSSCNRIYGNEAVACYSCNEGDTPIIDRLSSIDKRLLQVEERLNAEGVEDGPHGDLE